MGVIIVVVLVILIIINALQYFFSISVTAYLSDFFTNEPKIDIVVDQSTFQPSTVPTIKFKKQVFNIPGNYYSYPDAKALCQAYGSKLATYKQVEDSYENGGEWCNYGWSEGQMALFPTQQKTFDNLQKIKGHEHDCGRPGINGGYIANPYAKFGVNCYGKKPPASDADVARMNASKDHVYPKNKKDIELEEKVNYWKQNADKMLNINAFNVNRWFESWTGSVSGNTVTGNTVSK
jgi:hypothetical protein